MTDFHFDSKTADLLLTGGTYMNNLNGYGLFKTSINKVNRLEVNSNYLNDENKEEMLNLLANEIVKLK